MPKISREYRVESIECRVIANKEIIKNKYYKLVLRAPGIAKCALPGQFVMVKTGPGDGPLLRRPLGVHNTSVGKLTLLYEVVGKGTKILSQRKTGEYLDIIGPLGNGFTYPSSIVHRPSSIVLVAGGMGVAPLVFLAEKLAKPNTQYPILNTTVVIGAKTKTHILCEKEFKNFGCEVKIATDDGSKGFKGRVTQLLEDYLRGTKDERRRTIYACGPQLMLQEISRISQDYNIPAQVSLEEHMACGIGACLGCAVNTKSGYQRACKEGPVFDAQEIIWQ